VEPIHLRDDPADGAAVWAFPAGAAQADDITVLVLRRCT